MPQDEQELRQLIAELVVDAGSEETGFDLLKILARRLKGELKKDGDDAKA